MNSRETVLVTGASSGIGAELARCFARSGSDVALLARREEALNEHAQSLQDTYGVAAHVLPFDLSTPGIGREVVDRVDALGLTIDVLVNNAGFGNRGSFVDTEDREQLDMINVNISALTHLARLLLPGMLDRGRGGILNVGSTAGFQPGPNMAVYYATKAYVLSFSEALAQEVSGSGVTVTCLAPGPTKTDFADRAEMHDTLLFESGAAMSPAAVANYGYDAFRRGDTLAVPGLPNKVGAFATRFLPRSVASKVAAYLHRDG
ncbi:short-chain dehydrogenase [Longibacter salinarum]|uniref:Short-chain dehydrogenase n=1 Tax=Longibacter salinarum TaxID=1850348 RepID=A0A2A8D058_9BACT|nr:SDR family oxidoreductase [Longibacter salinarum]PEN14223.1 short-chain dehydrogenase [Longibacter salinarum]